MNVCEHKWEPITGMMCHLCKYEKCSVCGSIRRTEGCDNHGFRMEHYSHPAYYKDQFDGSIQRADLHIRQLEEAMKDADFDIMPWGDDVLEIGAGTGLYIPMWRKNLYAYTAIEPSEFGSRFMRQVYDAKVVQKTFDDLTVVPNSVDVVFSAHWLEHMRDADLQFAKMAEMAKSVIICLVPVGTDTANRDHWWYFTEEVLRKWSEACGFTPVVVRKSYSPHEDFLFLFATRKQQ